jgi:DNA-binding IclR family transcriptional regulator
VQKRGEPGQTARPAYPIASVDNALRLLTLFREQALNREESEEGVASVAVAVLGPGESPVTALVVSAPLARLDAEVAARIAAQLRAGADRLAELTGLHGAHRHDHGHLSATAADRRP